MFVSLDVLQVRSVGQARTALFHPERLFSDAETEPELRFVRAWLTGRGDRLHAPWEPHDTRLRASGGRRDGWGLPALRRVAVLAIWEGSSARAANPLPGWLEPTEAWQGVFEPLHAHGSIGGIDPLAEVPRQAVDGRPGVVVTTGRLVKKFVEFARTNNRVVEDLHQREGVLTAFNLTGSSVGAIGTLSFWRDLGDSVQFAYRGAEHMGAVRRMRDEGWAAETWFARLGLVSSRGQVAGRDPFAGLALTPAA